MFQVYTRCTVCNGTFSTVTDKEIATAPDVPAGMQNGMDYTGKKMTFYRYVEYACAYL